MERFAIGLGEALCPWPLTSSITRPDARNSVYSICMRTLSRSVQGGNALTRAKICEEGPTGSIRTCPHGGANISLFQCIYRKLIRGAGDVASAARHGREPGFSVSRLPVSDPAWRRFAVVQIRTRLVSRRLRRDCHPVLMNLQLWIRCFCPDPPRPSREDRPERARTAALPRPAASGPGSAAIFAGIGIYMPFFPVGSNRGISRRRAIGIHTWRCAVVRIICDDAAGCSLTEKGVGARRPLIASAQLASAAAHMIRLGWKAPWRFGFVR